MIVGMEFLMCFWTMRLDRPGQVARNPLSMALQRVLTGGYPVAACRKTASLWALGWWYALNAVTVFGNAVVALLSRALAFSALGLVGMGTYHSLLLARNPVNIGLL